MKIIGYQTSKVFLYLCCFLFIKQVQGDICPAFPSHTKCNQEKCSSFLSTKDTNEDDDEGRGYYWDEDDYDEDDWEEERFEFIPGLHDERDELADCASQLVEDSYYKSLNPTYKSLFGTSLYLKGWLPPEPLYLDFRKGFNYIFWWFEQPTHIHNFSGEEVSKVRYNLHNVWKYVQKEFQKFYEENVYRSPYYFADKGLLALELGNNLDAIECIKKIINNSEVQNSVQSTWGSPINFHIDLSKAYIDTNQFGQAIEILDKTIKKDPKNKEAYFERATAYFELGNFDKSLQDYIASDIKPTSIPNDCINFLTFSLGLSEGIIQGGAEATVEYIPSLLSSMYGLGQGLWAFAQDPINVSYEIVQATQDCIEFVRTHTPKEYLGKLVPELQYLIENWDTLDGREKGVLSGRIIGKYGVDIFAGMAAQKGMRYYQNLKKANSIMTYEAMKFSEANKQLIKTKARECIAIRKEMIKRGAFTLEIDKHTKHIPGSWNYIEQKHRSIWTGPNPQKEINKLGSKGIRVAGELGKPGYKEIVDCKKIIGIYITDNGKIRVPTTRATIHYSKKGAHIVPAPPR